MKRVKLTGEETKTESALIGGEYQAVGKAEFEQIAEAIVARRKDAVLNIRINSEDLAGLKKKAGKLGIKYQTFISEILHRVAHG